MDNKEKSQINKRASDLLLNMKNIIEKDTTLETIRENMLTVDEYADLTFAFGEEGFKSTLQYQITRTNRLLEYLAKKIDDLENRDD